MTTIELALKELIEMHASHVVRNDFSEGFEDGIESAIEVLEDFIEAGRCSGALGPSKERLLALADKMLVLGSPQSSKELLDMAAKFGV